MAAGKRERADRGLVDPTCPFSILQPTYQHQQLKDQYKQQYSKDADALTKLQQLKKDLWGEEQV